MRRLPAPVWIAAILYVFVSEALAVDEKWWGFINGSFFVGLIAGSLLCLRFTEWVENHLSHFILIGAIFSSLATVLFGLNSVPLVALLLSVLVGVFSQLKNIPQQTVVQTSVPKEQLPTVFTTLGAIGMGTFGVSSLLMGIVADLFGIRAVFVLSGVLLAIASWIAYAGRSSFQRTVRE